MKVIVALIICLLIIQYPVAAKCFSSQVNRVIHSKKYHLAKIVDKQSVENQKGCKLKLTIDNVAVNGEAGSQLCQFEIGQRVPVKVKSSCCDSEDCAVKTRIWFEFPNH